MSNVFEIAGEVRVFGFRAAASLFRRPLEGEQIRRQLADVGPKSLPLVIASGFALGAVSRTFDDLSVRAVCQTIS
jgi:ABC-type transporter Mla maintaining outer membrane lipid asymmetry permease subunit MlaE